MPVRPSRRSLLERAGLAALASAGLYGFLDDLVPSVASGAVAAPRRGVEQHLPGRVRLVTDNGVSVVVPPLHHRVVTARLIVPRRAAALRDAQRTLEHQVRLLESDAGPGLDVVLAWGLPYFARYLPRLANGARYPDYLPHDLEASRTAGSRVSAVLDAIRFPSDPAIDDSRAQRRRVPLQQRLARRRRARRPGPVREHLGDAASDEHP